VQLHSAYNISSNIITFSAAPANNEVIEVQVLGGAGSGSSTNPGFLYENELSINYNYTITSGKSAMSVGPINIANGVSVTVPSGSKWVVL
jgi:hypothetical protein